MPTRTMNFNINQVRDFNTTVSGVGNTIITANNNVPERLLVGTGGSKPTHSGLINAGDITNYRATFEVDADDEVVPTTVVQVEYSTDNGITWRNLYEDSNLGEEGYGEYQVYLDGGADGTDGPNEWIAIVAPGPAADPDGSGFMFSDNPIVSGYTFTATDSPNGNSQFSVVCFASDTMIRTPSGDRKVNDLKVGDLVCTKDNGDQTIRWIKGRMVPAVDQFAPILVQKGALGQNLPSKDLYVSRQHRFLSNSDITYRALGVSEVLVAAKFLTGLEGISEVHDMGLVDYWHFMFDDHQIVFANDAPAESLFLGENAKDTFEPEMIEELETLFPECFDEADELIPARAIADGKLGSRLSKRLKKHAAKALERI